MKRDVRPLAPLSTAKAGLIRQLTRHKKVRDIERAFVIEGIHPIYDLLRADPSAVSAIVVKTGFLDKADVTVRRTLMQSGVVTYLCRDMIFNQLSDLSAAPGVLAVVRQPEWDQAAVLGRPAVLGFYGECLQDPSNVGAIIRTAAAFEMDALWLSGDSADVFNPKVVRAASGAVLHLPVFTVQQASDLTRHQCRIFASERPANATVPIQDIAELPSRTVIALGNESRGLSDKTRAEASVRFHIPIGPHVDSLNVAASAAISAFYFRRLSQ